MQPRGEVIYIPFSIYVCYDIYHMQNMNPEILFSALANTTRLRCLLLLHANEELCVCELTHVLGVSQPVISRQLAILRETGLVIDRREGRWIYYRIHPELHHWAQQVLDATADGVIDQDPYCSDQELLSAMPNRPGANRCA